MMFSSAYVTMRTSTEHPSSSLWMLVKFAAGMCTVFVYMCLSVYVYYVCVFVDVDLGSAAGMCTVFVYCVCVHVCAICVKRNIRGC
jgi:hypothetical protein